MLTPESWILPEAQTFCTSQATRCLAVRPYFPAGIAYATETAGRPKAAPVSRSLPSTSMQFSNGGCAFHNLAQLPQLQAAARGLTFSVRFRCETAGLDFSRRLARATIDH